MRRLLCFPLFALLFAVACLAQEPQEPTNAEEAAAQKAKAAAELDAKYQAWVETLTPERQAWERVLQSELGGFYLPIHQRQKVAGQANAWDFVEDDPSLPRVLLIGDSVSRTHQRGQVSFMSNLLQQRRLTPLTGPDDKQPVESV